MSSDYSKGEHEFEPANFEPGRVHRVENRTALFGDGMTPAIALWDPKYPHNVGAAVRAASCFGAKAVIFSGNRIPIGGQKGWRLPREERMRGYYDVTILNDQYFFDRFSKRVTPIAVEVRENSEALPSFEHPEKPLYVFGPEDGTLPQSSMMAVAVVVATLPSFRRDSVETFP